MKKGGGGGGLGRLSGRAGWIAKKKRGEQNYFGALFKRAPKKSNLFSFLEIPRSGCFLHSCCVLLSYAIKHLITYTSPLALNNA